MACDGVTCTKTSYELRNPVVVVPIIDGPCAYLTAEQDWFAKTAALSGLEYEINSLGTPPSCGAGCHCARLKGEWEQDGTYTKTIGISVPQTECVLKVRITYEFWYKIETGVCIKDPPDDAAPLTS